MTIRVDCRSTDTSGGFTHEGGVFRFDPTAIEASICEPFDYSTKPVVFFNVNSFLDRANNIINVVEDHGKDPSPGMHGSALVAWFTDLAQCERANKAFAHLRTFKSEDPF